MPFQSSSSLKDNPPLIYISEEKKELLYSKTLSSLYAMCSYIKQDNLMNDTRLSALCTLSGRHLHMLISSLKSGRQRSM